MRGNKVTAPRRHIHKITLRSTLVVLALFVVALATTVGCATSEREMIPVEQVVTYTESADYERPATWKGRMLGAKSPYAAKCRKYREDIESYRTAYLASLGVGAASVILGLLSDDDTVKDVAGAFAASSLVAQAGSASAIEMTADEAREWGCEL
jgi:hypothetical protein